MCGSCWVEMGQPVVWDEDVAEAARLITDLYVLEPTGGPLHTALDDWNLDGANLTPTYSLPDREGRPGFPDRYSPEVHALCDRLAGLLQAMPVGWRASALAHAEGLAVDGAVAEGRQRWGMGVPEPPVAPVQVSTAGNSHRRWRPAPRTG